MLSEQHDQWHQIHGKYSTCPLDCGVGEMVEAVFEADQRVVDAGFSRIRCGACKGVHGLVATVKFCYALKVDRETFARNEAAMQAEIEARGECEHGLSKALCAGPGHYPMDM